jgi:hypothetical protein
VVAERKKDERKKIICILPSGTCLIVPEKSNVHTGTLVFFWGKFPSLDDTTKKYIYIYLVQILQRIFVEKMCQSCQILRESSLRLSYRETVSSRRLSKYNRILKFSYFGLWPMVKIWLIPLVDDHQFFLPPENPKRKESSSTHGKDFCEKRKGANQSHQILRKKILKLPY